MLSTACGTVLPKPQVQTVIREHYNVPTPDASLRTCLARPPKPVLTDDTDEAVLITNLDERGQDCASKLDRVWQSIDSAIAAALKLNAAK
jgi:hypothetical protein